MEKQIYGNITNTARTQFQFDRIYPNKREMDECCDSDGIYVGRYVLIEYDENPARNAIELIIKNGKFYYADFPAVQVIPNTTIAPGKLCYVKNTDGSYSFYEPQADKTFKLIYNCPSVNSNYDINWNIDYEQGHRGYDSTVWQKVYINNKQEYIMIAELNAVIPNFVMTVDAPNDNIAPHFDEHSSNMNLNLHMPAQWDFRVKQAEEGEPSDETTTHLIKYDEDGNPLQNPEEREDIPADIFYNKQAFEPVIYKSIEIVDSEEEEVYASGKYYYKIGNVFGLHSGGYSASLDETDFFEEIEETSPKRSYYTEGEKVDKLTEISLLKSTETNWENKKYYYIKDYNFTISVEDFDSTIQYFEQVMVDGTLIYTPVSLDESTYKVNTYYILSEVYVLDENKSFNENIVYYKKENDDYIFINLVNKPEYEENKYYIFCQNYYAIDYSEDKVPGRTYYTKNTDGTYSEVKFLKKAYTKNVYYYINEDGNYVVDTAETQTAGRQYYIKSIPELIIGVDKIEILPTGTSGRLYNNHNGAFEAANDIQEISINFPSIGAMMAKIWNLVYGKSRNDLIYGTPVYNPNMYGVNGEPLYQTGIDDLNNFVSIINQINDLIGHNLIKITSEGSIAFNENDEVLIDGEGPFNYLTIDNIEDYIYWIEAEDKFYRLEFNEVDNSYILIPMNQVNGSINSFYATLLEIQKILGTDEDVNTNSVKGALISLNNAIAELNNGFEFITIGDGLGYEIETVYRDVDGNYLYRDYNSKTFVEAEKYFDYFIKYYNNKWLTLYDRDLADSVDADTYMNYWVEKEIDGEIKYVLSDAYDITKDYYIFTKAEKLEKAPESVEELSGKYIIDLPKFYIWIASDEGLADERSYKDDLNIFEDIIALQRYAIYHENKNDSALTAEPIINSDNLVSLPAINIDIKGHSSLGDNFILPQVVVINSENESLLNTLPIGTMVYIQDS